MAQLSDDCFAFGGPLMSVDEVRALLAERVSAVAAAASVPLRDADGRVLAEPVRAPIDLPPVRQRGRRRLRGALREPRRGREPRSCR